MTRPGKVNRPPTPVLSSPFGMGGATPMPDLDDLGDVDAPSPADGDVLVWDDGAGTWVPGAGGGDPAEATALWRPVMTTCPSIVTTDGEDVWVVLTTVDGDAIMVYG